MAVYDNSLLVFSKRVKFIFNALKKFNVLNQYKAIKYIEKHLVSVKRHVKRYSRFNLHRRYVRTRNVHRFKASQDGFSEYDDKIDADDVNCMLSPTVLENCMMEDIEVDEMNQCDSFEINEFSHLESNILKNCNEIEETINVEKQYYEDSLLDDCAENVASSTHEKSPEYSTELSDKSNMKKKHMCIICKQPMKSYHSMIEHIFKHAGTQQSCLKCRTAFKNATAYKCHLLNNFCDSGGLKYNMDKFKTLSTKHLLFCPHCGQRYSKACNLRRHLNNCEFYSDVVRVNNIKCNICQLQFDTKAECDAHYTKHSKNKCQKCNLFFKSRKLLREHNTEHKKTSLTKYSCEVCIVSFRNRSLYRDHMRIFKNDKSHIEHLKISKSTSEQIWCKICVKSFVDMKTYKQHCLRQNHILNNEDISNVKPFVCDKCGLTFKNKNGLTGHLTRMHKSKAPLICEFCNFATTIASNMIRHTQIHHKQGIRKYACDKCPALFGTSSGLKDHMGSMHTFERPYSCDLCTKTFKLQSQLKRHKVIHNPTLPYPCQYCAMGFRRYAHLERHLVSKHDEHIQNLPSGFKMHKGDAYRRNKKPKEAPPLQTTLPEIPNVPEEQMFSLIDVQSGELVLLSVNDMSKNNVINMTAEGDLLNGVHIPDLWNNTEPELYSMDPILQDARNSQPTFMMPTNSADPQLTDATKNIIPEYVPHFVHNGKNIEMLTNEFDIVKENILSQNSLNSDIIVNNQAFSECVNFCSIVMDE